MPPGARVVIVDFDGEGVLAKCLESLVATVSPGTPLTIIDNASPSPSQLLIPDSLIGRVELLRLDRNVGYAGAIVAAWQMGDEKYIVIANNDLEFEPGRLDSLVATAESTGAHAVSAIIEHEGESEIERSTNASLNPLLYLIPGIFKDRTKAVYPSGACFLVRRDKDFPAPVDGSYFLYYEDVYIGFLLRSLGKIVVQSLDSKVRHIGSHSVKRWSETDATFFQERNRIQTQLLFFDFQTLLGLSPINFFDLAF